MPVCLLLALMATTVNAFVPVTPVLADRTGVGLRAASSRPVRAPTPAMVLKPEYLEGTGGPPAAGQGEWGTPQPAPSFDLPSDSGASVSLESLAGKWFSANYSLLAGHTFVFWHATRDSVARTVRQQTRCVCRPAAATCTWFLSV